MFKKNGLKRIKVLMLINNTIANEDKNNLSEYPEWEKTYKHKIDELAIVYNKFKIELIKTFFGIKDENMQAKD